MISVYQTGTKLSKFLNNWKDFEMKFRFAFPHYKFQLKTRKFRILLLIFYVFVPGLLVVVLNLMTFGLSFSTGISSIFLFFVATGNGRMEDGIFMYNCRVMQEIYIQVRIFSVSKRNTFKYIMKVKRQLKVERKRFQD